MNNKILHVMKKIFNIYIILIVGIFTLISCNKEETRAYLSNNPVPPSILTPVDETSIVFSTANDSNMLVVIWTRADFGFKSAVINSIQVAKKNDNFSKVKLFFVKPSNSDSASITYKEFNKGLLGSPLKLTPDVPDTVQVRIQTLLDKVDTLFSQTIRLCVTPHP
jgi:starch-binding outer membrane protein SusE/F